MRPNWQAGLLPTLGILAQHPAEAGIGQPAVHQHAAGVFTQEALTGRRSRRNADRVGNKRADRLGKRPFHWRRKTQCSGSIHTRRVEVQVLSEHGLFYRGCLRDAVTPQLNGQRIVNIARFRHGFDPSNWSNANTGPSIQEIA